MQVAEILNWQPVYETGFVCRCRNVIKPGRVFFHHLCWTHELNEFSVAVSEAYRITRPGKGLDMHGSLVSPSSVFIYISDYRFAINQIWPTLIKFIKNNNIYNTKLI